MKILTVETSCDESAISITKAHKEHFHNRQFSKIYIPGDSLNSQAVLHNEFGGVYPNLAKREHIKNLVPLLMHTLLQADMLHRSDKPSVSKEKLDEVKKILEREPELFAKLMIFFAQYKKPDIGALASVSGPGLAPALWVGVNFIKALSVAWELPIIGINHMEGHVFSTSFPVDYKIGQKESDLRNMEFPALILLLSGGHTELVSSCQLFQYRKLGQTLDDAVGEAYDKVARLLGLGYPGGPHISRLSEEFEKRNAKSNPKFVLPRPKIKDDDFDFSFSGLKTATLRLVESLGGQAHLTDTDKANIAYEFEMAVCDVVVNKTQKALENGEVVYKSLLFAGGVSANERLRSRLQKLANKHKVKFMLPPMPLTGDNSLMSALAAHTRYANLKDKSYITHESLKADGNWEIDA